MPARLSPGALEAKLADLSDMEHPISLSLDGARGNALESLAVVTSGGWLHFAKSCIPTCLAGMEACSPCAPPRVARRIHLHVRQRPGFRKVPNSTSGLRCLPGGDRRAEATDRRAGLRPRTGAWRRFAARDAPGYRLHRQASAHEGSRARFRCHRPDRPAVFEQESAKGLRALVDHRLSCATSSGLCPLTRSITPAGSSRSRQVKSFRSGRNPLTIHWVWPRPSSRREHLSTRRVTVFAGTELVSLAI